MRKYFLAIFMVVFLYLLCTCVKEEEPVLPYVKVDFSLNLLNYSGLLNGGIPLKYPNVGYKNNGIIIFPKGYGETAEFVAYDATCTRNISEETASINIDENNYTATCPKCKTVYNLNTGYARNGSFHLQQYAVRRDGYNRIYITTY